MKKVILICTYGHRNSGDDAQALSTAQRLCKALPEVEISVARNHSFDHDEIPGCTRNSLVYLAGQLMERKKSRPVRRLCRALGIFGYFYEPLVKRFRVWCLLVQGWLCARTGLIFSRTKSVREIIEIIRSGNLLYIGGGAHCNDIWFSSMVSKMIIIRLFHYFGKPIVMSGQGVGPLQSRYGRKLVKKTLQYLDTITLRDPERSERLLRKIGVSGPKIMSVGDDACGLEPASKDLAEEVIRNAGLDFSEPIMGVQVRFATYHHHREVLEYCEPTAGILDRLSEKFGVKILFFPSAFYSSSGWDDRDVAYRVLRHMRRWKQAAVVHEEYEAPVCKSLVRCFHMVLGTAYHPLVFALQFGIPAVGLYEGSYYEQKIGGIFDWYGLHDYAVEFSKATPETIEKLFQKLLSDPRGFSDMTAKITSKIRRNIDETITRTADLLKDGEH